MALSFLKKKTILGVDIGTSSIKIVELSQDRERFRLQNYGILDVEYYAESENKKNPKLPDGHIVAGLKELTKRMKVNSKDAVTSIPHFSTFSTIITLPYSSEQDLAKTLPLEAQKYVPLPLNDVVLDWSIVNIQGLGSRNKESADSNNPLTVEIFLVAVPKNETKRYQDIFKNARLNLRAIELENTALIRALIGNDQSPIAVVSVGGRSTSVFIVERGYERVNYNYEVGGFEMTKSIARALNISLERAEKLKKSKGVEKKNKAMLGEAVFSLIDTMAFEAKKTIDAYERDHKKTIAKIILTGGTSSMPGFMAYFQEKLGREISYANPFSKIILPKGINQELQKELSLHLTIALGLAMREI